MERDPIGEIARRSARALVVLVLGGCAAAGSSGSPKSAPGASYPAVFALLDDAERARRKQEIAADLADDLVVRAIEVDVFGLPTGVKVRPRSRGITGTFDASQTQRWSELLAGHAGAFGIADPRAFRLELRGRSFVAQQSAVGVAQLLSIVTVRPHADDIIIDGRYWPAPLPPATFDPEPIATQLVDRPYWLTWSLSYDGPHCDGCGGAPPPNRPREELVSTREDVDVEWGAELVCEDDDHVSLRRVARIQLRPRATMRADDLDDGWSFNAHVGSSDPVVTAPRVFDAVTGEELTERRLLPLQAGDIRLPSHGWRPTICEGAPPSPRP